LEDLKSVGEDRLTDPHGQITDVLNPDNPEPLPEAEQDPDSQTNPDGFPPGIEESPHIPQEEMITGEDMEFNKKAFNPWVLVVLGVVWVIFVFLPFLRGGPSAKSFIGISFCSAAYWAVTFIPFPFYFLVSAWMIRIAKKYPVIGGKADLSKKQIFYLILCGVVAGIASGFLGIGGGMIKGPMLLALGIEAEEMAATSSFLILLTSSITSIQFIARGTMPYAEFGIYVAFGFVSFLVGVNILKVLINKTHNRSLVLYVLGGAIALSAILMSYVGIDQIVKSVKAHQSMGFRPYCRPGDT
jgi:uncharacterized membrane protein YfcA